MSHLLERGFWQKLLNPAAPGARTEGVSGRDRFTLDELRNLYDVLSKNPVVHEGNRALVVETIRSIAEFIIWGDQNEPRVFEFFLENNIMAYLHRVLLQPANRSGDVAKQVLQTLSIIIQNIASETGTYFLFSNDHVNNIIEIAFDFEHEEVLGFYISLLKAISLKLSKRTAQFFVRVDDTGNVVDFPLYSAAARFAHHKEGMVRAGVRTMFLNIFSVSDPYIDTYVTRPGAAHYLTNVAHYLANHIQILDKRMQGAEAFGSQALSSLDSQLAEVEDILSYSSDVLGAGHSYLGHLLSQQLWTVVVGPLLLAPLLEQPSDPLQAPGPTTLRPACALYVLERFFQLVSYPPLINNMLLALFGRYSPAAAAAAAAVAQVNCSGGHNSSCPGLSGIAASVEPVGGQLQSAGASDGYSTCREGFMAALHSSGVHAANNALRALVAMANSSQSSSSGSAALLCALGLLPRAHIAKLRATGAADGQTGCAVCDLSARLTDERQQQQQEALDLGSTSTCRAPAGPLLFTYSQVWSYYTLPGLPAPQYNEQQQEQPSVVTAQPSVEGQAAVAASAGGGQGDLISLDDEIIDVQAAPTTAGAAGLQHVAGPDSFAVSGEAPVRANEQSLHAGGPVFGLQDGLVGHEMPADLILADAGAGADSVGAAILRQGPGTAVLDETTSEGSLPAAPAGSSAADWSLNLPEAPGPEHSGATDDASFAVVAGNADGSSSAADVTTAPVHLPPAPPPPTPAAPAPAPPPVEPSTATGEDDAPTPSEAVSTHTVHEGQAEQSTALLQSAAGSSITSSAHVMHNKQGQSLLDSHHFLALNKSGPKPLAGLGVSVADGALSTASQAAVAGSDDPHLAASRSGTGDVGTTAVAAGEAALPEAADDQSLLDLQQSTSLPSEYDLQGLDSQGALGHRQGPAAEGEASQVAGESTHQGEAPHHGNEQHFSAATAPKGVSLNIGNDSASAAPAPVEPSHQLPYGQAEDLLDALFSLLSAPLLPVPALWHAVYLIAQYCAPQPQMAAAAASPSSSAAQGSTLELSAEHQRLLQSALEEAASRVLDELSGMWCDAIFPLLCMDWTSAAEATIRPILRASSEALMAGPALYPPRADATAGAAAAGRQNAAAVAQMMGLSMSAAAALHVYHAVQRLVAMLQLKQLLTHGKVSRQPPLPTPPNWDQRKLDLGEGQQVDLQPTCAIPCIVSFQPGQERRVYFSVSGAALARVAEYVAGVPITEDPDALATVLHSSAAVVLADPAPTKLNSGIIAAASPLMGAEALVDRKVAKWVHVHVRPSVGGLLRVLRAAPNKKGGVLGAMRQLADGHWVLAFPDADRSAAACKMVKQQADQLRSLYADLLGPLIS